MADSAHPNHPGPNCACVTCEFRRLYGIKPKEPAPADKRTDVWLRLEGSDISLVIDGEIRGRFTGRGSVEPCLEALRALLTLRAFGIFR